jgi:TolB-like protein/Tfp pilus assembly protein PilF
MKRCPECRRDYNDDSMSFCLDDGAELLFGPASGSGAVGEPARAILSEPGAVATGFSSDEPQTAILHSTAASGEAPTRSQIHTTEQTAVFPGEAEASAHRAAEPNSQRNRLLAVCGIGVLLLVGGFFGYRYFSAANTEQVNSIAVLPFENRSGSSDTEYLSDGLADSLIYRLSQLPNLKVSPTSSVMRYKGKSGDTSQIAKELNVDAVMSGRLVQIGDSLNISVQLTDARTDKLIWAEQYDRKMSDLLATQREIATAITEKLQLKLSGDERGITKKYTNSNEAYQLYLKGRYHFARRTKDDINRAIESYEQAIRLDPNFALAYARIAEAYNQMSNYPYAAPKEAFPKAKAAALRALEIDQTLAEAHAALGNTLTSFDWDWKAAELSFTRSIELDPNSATTHYRYATEYLISVGRTNEGLAEVRRALEIEPLDPNMVANLARVYLYDGQRDAGLAQARKSYEIDPTFPIARLVLGMALNANGLHDEAIVHAESILQADPNNQHMLQIAGFAYAKTGRKKDAEAVIEKLREIGKTQYVIPSFVASIYGVMGEKDSAFEEMETALEMRDSWLKWIKAEPIYDPLRDDPRFKDLLKRMGLPE